MKIKGLISGTLFIAGMLLCAVGIVILEVLNFRKATAYEPEFDVGVWISIAGIVIMAVSFAVEWLPIKRVKSRISEKENRADS